MRTPNELSGGRSGFGYSDFRELLARPGHGGLGRAGARSGAGVGAGLASAVPFGGIGAGQNSEVVEVTTLTCELSLLLYSARRIRRTMTLRAEDEPTIWVSMPPGKAPLAWA